MSSADMVPYTGTGAGGGGGGGELAGGAAALHCSWLRRVGFLRLARPSRSHEYYRRFVLALTTTYLLQELVYAYQERTDMEALARVMFLLLCHVTSLAKQLVFQYDAARVDALVWRLDSGWAAGGARLTAGAAGARRLLRCYSGAAVLTCTLWLVFPVLRHVRAEPVHFPLWMPVDYRHTPGFVATLAYTYVGTTLVGIANTTMDAFMATVLYQSNIQLHNVRDQLEHLSGEGGEVEGEERLRMRRLLACLAQHESAVQMTSLLQDTFGLSILIQFGIGGWILCMAAYQLAGLSVVSVEFASMCLFMTCILTELLLYCYYGNEVTVESARLVTALYSTRWECAERPFRRALLLAMTRAQRALCPRAARLVPLSLDTFVKILKSSYTFYVVLRQTK